MSERSSVHYHAAMLLRWLIGTAVAALVSRAARATGSLTETGAMAAIVVGSFAVAGGWSWAVLLFAFFATATALTRWRRPLKQVQATDRAAFDSARDAVQVIANGGLFALGALVLGFFPNAAIAAATVGALATATGDTWATEVGTGALATPHSMLTWQPVAPGESGGITAAGTVAGVCGAAMIGGLAFLMGHPLIVATAGAAGGIGGMLGDSILGATLQSVRWCDTCGAHTEQRVHSCGNATRHLRGLAWLDNDGVNGLATAFGAVLAAASFVFVYV
jgi:uncharacterized protein (TIGR00297 family)